MQVLVDHLYSAFCNYLRSTSYGHAAAASASSLIPPSLEEASGQALDGCAERVSAILMDNDEDLIKKNLSQRDTIQTKIDRHRSFIAFLQHSGIYRKLALSR